MGGRHRLATIVGMGTLYLVRHGQASFGAANYDQLSPLGHQQCLQLGRWFKAKGRRFEAVITGTLQRQLQSQAAIAEGMGLEHKPVQLPGLNEYDSRAVITALQPQPQPLAKPDTPALHRAHFQLLRQGLAAWMAGQTQPAGMPSYADYVAGVGDALDRARAIVGGDVLMVSSGGPISTAVGRVLGTAPETTIELNLRLRNSAITEFAFNPRRHSLLSFNTLPHLDAEAFAGWVTYT